jgi:hypothetical protein
VRTRRGFPQVLDLHAGADGRRLPPLVPKQFLVMMRQAIPQSDLLPPQSDALFLRMTVCSQPILCAPGMHAAVGLEAWTSEHPS